MKIINRFKGDAGKYPVHYSVMVLLVAASCIFFPTEWPGEIIGKLNALSIVRFMFGAIGILLIFLFGIHSQFKLHKSFFKNLDIFIVGLIICLNNFPIIALIDKSVTVTANSGDVFSFIVFCVSVGFFEEIFFRGLIFMILLNAFKNSKKGLFLSILCSSAAFGLIHLVNLLSGASIGDVLMQIGYSTLIGALAAAVLVFTRSIYSSIFLHALYNTGGLLLEYTGNGDQWNTPTIIITVILSIAAIAWILIRFIKADYNMINMRKSAIKEEDGLKPSP